MRRAGAPAPHPGLQPPAGLQPYPAPPAPLLQVRPGLVWIGAGWLVFLVLTVVGLGILLVEGVGGSTVTGPERFFRDRVPVPLATDGQPIVYALQPGPVDAVCVLDGHLAGDAAIVPLPPGWTARAAGQEWVAVYAVERPPGSSLRIRCDGGDTVFGLGSRTAVDGAGAAALLLPLIGLVAALATTILVAARRRTALERVFASWSAPPPRPVVATRAPTPPPAPLLGRAGAWAGAPADPFPVPARPAAIHPRAWWITLAWVLYGVLVAASVAVYLTEGLGTRTHGEPSQFFRTGETVTISRTEAELLVLYTSVADAGVGCAATGPDAHRVELLHPGTDRTVRDRSGREWHLGYRIALPATGEYGLRCDGEPAELAIGREPDPVGAVALTFGLAVVLLAGLVAAVVTTVRVCDGRRAARARLARPSGTPPPR